MADSTNAWTPVPETAPAPATPDVYATITKDASTPPPSDVEFDQVKKLWAPVEPEADPTGGAGLATKAWQWANTPLAPEIEEAAKAIAEHVGAPHLADAELNEKYPGAGTASAMIRGGVAGMTEGAGRLLSSFTSPVGIALTLSGLSEDAPIVKHIPALQDLLQLPAVKTLQAAVRTGAGGAFAGEGAHDVATAPTLGGKAAGVVEMATGGLGLESGVPALTGAVGDVIANRSARQAQKLSGQQMSDLMTGAPPSKSASYTPHDLTRAKMYLDAEHATSPITSVEDLRDASDSAITQIEQHVQQAIAANPNDLIRTKPIDAVVARLRQHLRGDALKQGLAALKDLPLWKPLTIEQADRLRLQLNYENKGILKKNNYDVQTARAVDPGFAAREAAVGALRDGIYQQLEARGIHGIADLRRDEGALIKVRNAADSHSLKGESKVGGTGANTLPRRIAGAAVVGGSAMAGDLVGGYPGAAVGAMVGEHLRRSVVTPNMTRNELIERAFKKSTGHPVALPTIPAAPVIAGHLQAAPIVTPPPADPSFVRGVPAEVQRRPTVGLLPAATIPMGSGPDRSEVRAVPAGRGLVVRDPKTGRYKRVYTSN